MKYSWKETGIGRVDNLGRQFAKVMKGCNQGSIATRRRYAAACERFVKYVAEKYNLQKIQNIQQKHLDAYAQELLVKGKSDKYVKTDLSAIRFMHRQIPQAKYVLEDGKESNKKIGLYSTPDGRADRAWTKEEIEAMQRKAIELGRPEIANVIEAMRKTGMRLDEACTVRRDQVEAALRTGWLHLTNTKGGRPRDVLLSNEAKEFFLKILPKVERGEYVFTPEKFVKNHKIHSFKKSIQDFILRHRDKIQQQDRKNTGHNVSKGEKGALTAHGLRHTFARTSYGGLIRTGWRKEDAEEEIAEQLGHGRASVTKIYITEDECY